MHLAPTPRRRAALAISTLLLAGASAALAFTDPRPPSRFDDFAMRADGGAIALAPRALGNLDPADPLRAGWEAFDRAHGGAWSVYLDERTGMPTLVSGRGVSWFDADGGAPTLATLEAAARAFLAEHRALLAAGWDAAVLDAAASGQWRAGAWQVVFRQEVDGVPVDGARLEFQVRDGRMVQFGAQKWGVPRLRGVPAIDADDARTAVETYLGTPIDGFDAVGEATLAIVPRDPGSNGPAPAAWKGARGAGLAHALVWRLSFRDPEGPATWVAEVDARDARVVAFRDETHYAAIRGGVFPVSPDGDCAGGGCEIAGFPMPFADYTESGQAVAYADTAGNLACADPQASFETRLVGPFVEVRDECGPTAETGGCATGIDLGNKAGENCEVALGASSGNTAAARSGYYQLNRVAEIARHYQPGNAWLEGRVVLNVNVASTCNATWGGEVNMYRAGNGCGNTAEIQGVVVHEWGHGYDQNDGGGYDNTSEAYADVVAMFASRESCMGRGFFVDGGTCSGYGDTCLTCTGVRDHDFAARTANTPATPQGFVQNQCPSGGGGPCGYETHCEAYPIGEAIFDLATRDLPAAGLDPASAWQLAERLWFETRSGSGGDIYTCALPSSDSCAAGTWYQRMRNADDDDGNLANGTPHAAALFAAFDRHGIACGAATDPENLSTSSCPALATPALEAVQTAAGTELSWGAVENAAEYLVLRGELGCDRQQVPVATVPGGTTTWLDDVSDPGLPLRYRVQAIGANAACRSAVSNCAVAPDGPRLQVNRYRVVEDPVNGNANGFLDPGETGSIPVTLFNGGTIDALGVEGRLRVADPALGRVVEPVAAWGDLAVYEEKESVDPHFEVVLFDAATCGSSIDLELEATAAGATPLVSTIRVPLGRLDRDYPRDAPQQIPNPGTLNSQIVVTDDRTLTELDVSVDINQFQLQELIVSLTSPAGTTVRLLDRPSGFFGIDTRFDLLRDPSGPGTMDDFVGESTLGTWTLSVQDTGGGFGQGTLVSWTLHATVEEPYDCEPYACPEPAPTEAPGGLTVDKTVDGGTGRVDLVFGWDAVAGVAGYHVLQSDDATFGGAVDLAGRTAGATALTVEGGVASSPALAFFQVRAVNGCGEESP